MRLSPSAADAQIVGLLLIVAHSLGEGSGGQF